MVKLISTNGNRAYDVNEYVVDTEEELVTIPKSAGMGSLALVLGTANIFRKNGTGTWINLGNIGGGGSGGGTTIYPITED